MWRGIKLKNGKTETVQSYLGLLTHGNTHKLQGQTEEIVKEVTGAVD